MYRTWNLVDFVYIFHAVIGIQSVMAFEKIHFHKSIIIPQFPSNKTLIFQTLTQISIQECIEECKRLGVCDYINFHVRNYQCELLKSESNGNVMVVNKPGNAYGIKTDWNLNEAIYGCSSCGQTERCGLETNPAACKVEACGPPSYIQDTVLYGNIFRTGDRLLYQCNDTMSTSSQTTCQSDGGWSNANLTCTESFSCVPLYSDTFYSTTLSDNTVFEFLVTTTHMDHSSALTYCQDRCGRLVEVVSWDKFSALKDFLTSQSGYGNTEYYVDGQYDASIDTFVTSSGVVLHHDYSMWSSNPAFFGNDQPCLRMKHSDGFRMNTKECTVSFGVICEKAPLS